MRPAPNRWRPLLLVAVVACTGRPSGTADPVRIFAAASLADAVTEIARGAMAETGIPITLSFAASSTLASQIQAGAPADVFLSADPAWVDALIEQRLLDETSRVAPITTDLVVIAPRDAPSTLGVPLRPAAFLQALGPTGRLAVGDPEHVPAGRYARAALVTLGLWAAVEQRLAPAQDVRGALALVARGETPLGIVYASDARVSDAVRIVATLPATSHPPIHYVFTMVAGRDTARVRTVFARLTSAAARAIFVRNGFEAAA